MTNRRLKRQERRLKDLQRHYPDNMYKIDDKFQIIRVSGRRPHKIKRNQK